MKPVGFQTSNLFIILITENNADYLHVSIYLKKRHIFAEGGLAIVTNSKIKICFLYDFPTEVASSLLYKPFTPPGPRHKIHLFRWQTYNWIHLHNKEPKAISVGFSSTLQNMLQKKMIQLLPGTSCSLDSTKEVEFYTKSALTEN